MARTVSVAYFKSLIDIISKMPDAPERLWCDILGRTGLTYEDLSNPKLRISLQNMTDSFDLASEVLNDPIIGFKAGCDFHVYSFVRTGTIFAYSQSLADAVKVNSDYNMLVETVGRSRLKRSPQGDYMIWDTQGLDQAKHRHICEAVIAGYAVTATWLGWGFGESVVEAGFCHPQAGKLSKENLDFMKQICGGNIRFSQSNNYIKFADQIVDRELPSHNPEKMQQIRLSLDVILSKVSGHNELKDKVFLHISDHVKSGTLSELNVAKKLGMSERSLRRELAAQGLSYRQCVDDVRQMLCQSYMETGRSLTEIAVILGYNDQAAFTRAFKRWHGVPPSKYKIKVLS